MKKKRWFTLVEVMITIVIMGLLIALLFEIFVTIWRIAVFIQLNRTVHWEMIYVAQTIQNMVDDQYMNLTWLDLSLGWGDETTQWRKQNLQLADDEFIYVLNNNCVDESQCFLNLSRTDNGWWLAQTGNVQLTNPDLTHVQAFAVRTIPNISPTVYTWLVHPWFWFFMDLRVPQYDETKRWLRVQQNIQLFFTMRKYE